MFLKVMRIESRAVAGKRYRHDVRYMEEGYKEKGRLIRQVTLTGLCGQVGHKIEGRCGHRVGTGAGRALGGSSLLVVSVRGGTTPAWAHDHAVRLPYPRR